MQSKCRVGVFMGGKSIEREVSFNSGRTICDHLDTTRYIPVPIFQTAQGKLYLLPWHFLHRGKTADFVHRLAHEASELRWDDLPTVIDFAYIAMHGRYAEDGALQSFLEILNIPYLGSKVLASALSMDKIIQKEVMRMHDIQVARDIVIHPHELSTLNETYLLERMQQAHISLPCIVKPHQEGSSLGVSIVNDAASLMYAIHQAATIDPTRLQSVLIEEKIVGMEFTCIIIHDYKTNTLIPLPPTEIVYAPDKAFLDYEQKYMPGRALKYTPARCTPELINHIQDTSMRVMHALELRTIGRIDGFVTAQGTVIITDPNALAGMAPSSFIFNQAAEIHMSHTDLINHLIDAELHMYNKHDQVLEFAPSTTTNEQKNRIAVLLGGSSNEREISLESGRNVIYKLSPEKYTAIPLFVTRTNKLHRITQRLLVHNATAEIEEQLDAASAVGWHQLPEIADFVFIALHGGVGENGTIQGVLEMLGMPYNGSSILSSALCMDKYKTAQYLRAKNFDTPQQLLISRKAWQQERDNLYTQITTRFTFPLIVKPHDDGCSVLVSKVTDPQSLTHALDAYFTSEKAHALVEEYIVGTELTVGVLGNHVVRALPPTQTVVARDILSMEEKFLPGAGENQTPAPLPPAALGLIQDTIARAYQAIGCKGYARIDCFYQTPTQSPTGHERVVILEFNTLPALTPATCIFHQAAEVGMRPMEFIDEIITLGFNNHQHVHSTPSDAVLQKARPEPETAISLG